MEIEIRLSKISIEALAKLEALFGEGIKIISFNTEQKSADAIISNTRIREKELFDLAGTSIHDLFALIIEKNDSNKKYIQEIIHKSVDELNLSLRPSNCLRSAGIKLIGELASKSEKDLLATQNFASKSLNEVKDALADFNLTLGMKFENFPNQNTAQQKENEK